MVIGETEVLTVIPTIGNHIACYSGDFVFRPSRSALANFYGATEKVFRVLFQQ